MMRAAFALVASAIWFALSIGLWAMRPPALTQLAPVDAAEHSVRRGLLSLSRPQRPLRQPRGTRLDHSPIDKKTGELANDTASSPA